VTVVEHDWLAARFEQNRAHLVADPARLGRLDVTVL